MAPQTSTRMTYEEYLKLPDDGKYYEIIDGELCLNPTPVPCHQRIVVNLLFALKLYFREHGGGEVLVAPMDVVFNEENMLEPDLIVITAKNAGIVGKTNLRGAPDLVIEVLSPGTRRRDEVQKRKIYDEGGVAEYWIVDGEDETVRIDRRVRKAFQTIAEISTEAGGTITTPVLPGFALDVREIFADQA